MAQSLIRFRENRLIRLHDSCPYDLPSAHNGTDHITVHVQVTCTAIRGKAGYPRINTTVYTHRQAETCGIYCRNHLVEVSALELEHMQHRTELLTFQRADIVNLNQRWREVRANTRLRRQRTAVYERLLLRHALNVRSQRYAGRIIDNRPDISGQVSWITDDEFIHVPLEQIQGSRLDLLLHTEQTQG